MIVILNGQMVVFHLSSIHHENYERFTAMNTPHFLTYFPFSLSSFTLYRVSDSPNMATRGPLPERKTGEDFTLSLQFLAPMFKHPYVFPAGTPDNKTDCFLIDFIKLKLIRFHFLLSQFLGKLTSFCF